LRVVSIRAIFLKNPMSCAWIDVKGDLLASSVEALLEFFHRRGGDPIVVLRKMTEKSRLRFSTVPVASAVENDRRRDMAGFLAG
jgi:hypothetical protein